MSRLDWMDDALCAQVGTEIFFPEKGGTADEAKSICHRCTVQSECLTYALDIETSGVWTVTGVWGGTTPIERRDIRRRLKAA